MSAKTAIIIGATGLTGSILLERLIADDSYSTIKLFSRKPCHQKSSKIKEFLGDIINLEEFKGEFTGDEVFCCIGTTAAKTKDKYVYERIDVGIPSKAAKLAKENQISTFIVISALGADVNSKVFYNRIKGKMEESVLSQEMNSTYILRPSLILGNRNERRIGERLATVFMAILQPILIGKIKKYRGIEATSIAICMHKLTQLNRASGIVESDEIQAISEEAV
ncbi:NAD(P)H-binding protein [Labilibacter marinus]|uniref:NAD(P)H-binding protein n=1 Tax=Labilibacter marinus TaxID=1477105 RepID=UPI0009500915|nr:NAD(P)H-binding protein [Labilibacter marinus]